MNIRRAVLLTMWLLLGLFGSAALAASVGNITQFSGSASIRAADGTTRAVAKGAPLYQGDTAVTGDDGQIELRFSDDSVVFLHPASRFRVDEYVYRGKKNGDAAKSFFSLLKGGLRTITGMIGKINRPAYAIHTPNATIGIRGTEYTAVLQNGLHVSVQQGEISLTNRAGSFAVAQGQRAYVADQDSTPRYLKPGQASPADGSGAAGGVQIRGNTRIDAATSNIRAIAVGQGNKAANQAGVIGGE
jgi:hypothetical protein